MQSDVSREPYISAAEAAGLLHVRPQTLAVWRCTKKGPPYTKVGRNALYRASDVLTWMENRTYFAQA